MKTSNIYRRTTRVFLMCIAAFMCIAQKNVANAQTIRSYASRQAVKVLTTGTYSDAGFAIDGNPATASTLSQPIYVGLGAPYVEQILDFNPDPLSTSTYAATIPANTSITIKVEMPSAILSLMNKIEVQAITGLNQSGGIWNYTNIGSAVSGGSLVSLLSGSGSSEVTITPNVAFQGIRIRVSTLTTVANSAGVYHAYIKVPAPGNLACNERIDVLSGVRPVTLLGGVLSTTASVSNPWNVIDNSMSTYAQLNTGLDVLNEVYHTTIFNTPSKIGDTLKITLQDVSGTLLSIGALTGFSIKFYDGVNMVQSFINDPSLLSLKLLNPVSNIMQLSSVPTVSFDRVEIVIGGVANALSGLRIYDVNRENAGVLLTNEQADIYVYAGQSYTLSASPIAAGDDVVFYDAATNGNGVSAGPTATTEEQSGTTLTFYAGTTRNGCSESSNRKKINVHIIGFVRNFPVVAYVGQSYSSDVIVTDTSYMPTAPDFQYSTTSIMPDGLTMDPNTGMITGMPTSAGPYPPIVVTITDAANNLPVGTFTYILPIQQNAPLGVDFELSCSAVKNQVLLNWVTYSETENAGFTIERSFDGDKFAAVGTIKSKYENGNGIGTMQYDFADRTPNKGINYYRLKQTDKSGKVYYSHIVSSSVNIENQVRVYPNPVKSILNIQAENAKAIYIYNAVGQMFSSQTNITQNNIGIDVSSLANGFYTLKTQTATLNTTTTFVISH